jgi:type II secretory pathway component PulF
MSDVTLQRVLAFNRELLALTATGLPLDLGFVPSDTTREKLERINAALSTRVQRGQGIEQAINEESELTPQYLAAVVTWLRCDDPTVALDGLAKPAVARRQLGLSLGQSMLYPLIVLTLTYFGFLYLCGVTAPKIAAIYQQIALAPSDSLAFLAASRQLMPIWAPLPPLLLIIAVIGWRLRVSGLSWLPGSSRYLDSIRNANLAQQLARLMESGMSLQESVALAGPLRGIAAPADGTGSEDVLESLPSLLRWAVSADLGGEPIPKALRFVAQTYRQKAHRQEAIWRFVAPTICGVLIGGTFVFGYALSLFLPVVQLLEDISLPGGA